MVDEVDLRQQLITAFEGADYPVSEPMDLLPALPKGPMTRFESDGFSMTAMEIYTTVSGGEFPYEDVEPLVDDLLAELRDAGRL